MTWKLQVTCGDCGYVGDQVTLGEAGQMQFAVPADCPACEYNAKTAPSRRPSRFTIWRETRAFRRQLAGEQTEQEDFPSSS